MLLKLSNIKIVFVTIFLLLLLRLFSLILIPDRVFDYIEIFLLFIIFVFIFFAKGERPNAEFASYVNGIIFLTLLSSVSAYFYHEQGFLPSLVASRTIFFWLFYYVLYKISIDKEDLRKVLLFLGMIWALLMIYQQFSTDVLFNLHADEIDDMGNLIFREERGLKRIYMPGTEFGLFMLFYSWEKIYKKLNFKYFVLFVLALTGLFFTDSRQVIFGVLAILLFSFLFRFSFNNKKKVQFLFLFSFIVIVLIIIGGNYILNLIKLSQDQKSLGGFIRYEAIKFYLFDYNPSFLCYIIGNGWENFYSPYGHELKRTIESSLGYFRSDIGIIGALNKFGIIYVIFVLRIYYKLIFKRKKLFVPIYIREFFIMCFITSFTGANYFEFSFIFPLFVCLFYIIDEENKSLQTFEKNQY